MENTPKQNLISFGLELKELVKKYDVELSVGIEFDEVFDESYYVEAISSDGNHSIDLRNILPDKNIKIDKKFDELDLQL